MFFHFLSNSIDNCDEDNDHEDYDPDDHGDHDPDFDENYHVDLSDVYQYEGIDDDLDALDRNSYVDYNDEFDDVVDDATSLHTNDRVDDPDFHKSLVSIHMHDTNIVDSDDVAEDEYTHHDDQYSHYNITDYSQVVLKSHDKEEHSD